MFVDPDDFTLSMASFSRNDVTSQDAKRIETAIREKPLLKTTYHIILTFKKKLWPLIMDGFQLPQG